MNLISKIAKNTIYQIAGKAVGMIFGLITVGMTTRYLGQEGYGYYTTIIAFMQFFSVLVDFGLQMTTTQMISVPGTNQKKIFANVLTLRLVSSIALLGGAAALAWILPYPLIIKQGICIISLSFLFVSLQTIFISVFQKHIDMAKIAMAEIYSRGFLFVGVWLIVYYQLSLLHIVWAVVLSTFIQLIILFTGVRRYIQVSLELDKKYLKKIIKTAWPLAITVALSLVYFRADTIIMSLFRPQNEVGLYGAPYKVLEILIQFPYLFLGLLLPVFTKFFSINKNLFNLTIQKAFDFLIIIGMPMVFGTLLLGNKIMVLVAGPEFMISGDILKILIFATFTIYLSALFGYAIVAAELPKKMVKFYLADAIISLPLYLILIPIYSYWAAAYLTIFTEAIILFSSYYVLKKHAHIDIKCGIVLKSLLASLGMALVLYLLINQGLFTLIIIGVIIYFWFLYLLRGINKNDITNIIQLRKT